MKVFRRICIALVLMCAVMGNALATGSVLFTYEVQQLYYTVVDGVMNESPDHRESSVHVTDKTGVTVTPPPSAYGGYLFDPDSGLNALAINFDDPSKVYTFRVIYVKETSSAGLSDGSSASAPSGLSVVFEEEELTVFSGRPVSLKGYVLSATGSLGQIDVFIEGHDEAAAEFRPGSNYFDLSSCVLATNAGPLSVPGTYRIVLRIWDGAGNTWDYPGCAVNILPAEENAPEATMETVPEMSGASPLESVQIAAGHIHTAVLRPDGTVISFGSNEDDRIPKKPVTVNQTAVSHWTDITAIDCGEYHTVGLRADGTVVAAGLNKEGQCDVAGWNNIVAVAAGEFHTVGVQEGGMSLFATGWNENGPCNVSGLVYAGAAPIIAVTAGYEHTVVLREDGTVAAVGNNQKGSGQCSVHGWQRITQIDAGTYHTVGLREDGTVAATGDNTYGQCNVGSWYNIVAIAAGDYYTIGLRSDGTVVATGQNDMGQCNVFGWTDIVEIAAGHSHTVGLQANGSGIATGRNDHGQCGAFAISVE